MVSKIWRNCNTPEPICCPWTSRGKNRPGKAYIINQLAHFVQHHKRPLITLVNNKGRADLEQEGRLAHLDLEDMKCAYRAAHSNEGDHEDQFERDDKLVLHPVVLHHLCEVYQRVVNFTPEGHVKKHVTIFSRKKGHWEHQQAEKVVQGDLVLVVALDDPENQVREEIWPRELRG